MICIKFDQKIKKNLKNLNFGLLRFFWFFLNLGFFRSHFPALERDSTMRQSLNDQFVEAD